MFGIGAPELMILLPLIIIVAVIVGIKLFSQNKGGKAMQEITTKSREVPSYAKACGILSLIVAIVGIVIPVIGVLFITPIAIVLGAIALYGGYKGMGIATSIIVTVNLIISPTFWANIGAGATFAGASGNRFLTYFDAIGVIVMLYLAVRKQK